MHTLAAYDGFGRLTRRQDKNGVVQHFACDDEQRVKEIRFEGNSEFRRVEYRYDPLGRRTHKVLWRYNDPQPETIRFDWQGLQLAGEQSDREPDHYVQYVYTEGSYEPLARVDSVFDDCEIYWYHTELNGLPERVTDADGQTVWRGQFSTWGKTERELSVPQWQVPQNLRFQGQYLDRESGLHYNLFRYYDPVAGRYTQMDPISLKGGINLYAYAPNPLSWIDPLGLSCFNSSKRFDKRNNITSRFVDLLTGKKPADVENYLKSKGWTATYPQSATPAKTQHVVFVKTTKSGEVYHLDYNPAGKTHGSDYWKVIKPNDPVETVYGRIGHGGFDHYDRIKNSPVYVDGTLMNPWGK